MSVVHNVQCATEYKGKHECNDKRTRRYKKKAQIELLYNIVTSTLGQINSRLVTTKFKKISEYESLRIEIIKNGTQGENIFTTIRPLRKYQVV